VIGEPHNSLDPTSMYAKWHVVPSNGLRRVHECEMTDRQMTDHATEKWVATGKIACAILNFA